MAWSAFIFRITADSSAIDSDYWHDSICELSKTCECVGHCSNVQCSPAHTSEDGETSDPLFARVSRTIARHEGYSRSLSSGLRALFWLWPK
jgi:hypothetical protein